MIEKIKEFTGDLGIDIVKSNLQEIHDLRAIRSDIIGFVQDRMESVLLDDSCYSEIDYQGYLNYIRIDMLDEIRKYICTVDYDKAESIKQMILAKALSYERNSHYSKGCILFITENCINIVKEYYIEKLDEDNRLQAHITVQTILGSIIPKIDTIDENVETIKESLKEQEKKRQVDNSSILRKATEIADMHVSGSEKSKELFASADAKEVFLAYCEQDASYIAELKEWLDCKLVIYDEYCYTDEYIVEEDLISYLENKKIIILVIGETFLRNIHCVYGMSEMIKSRNYTDRIFSVILDRSIFGTENRTERIGYWETRERELRIKIESLEKVQHAYKLVSEELIKYERTAQSIDEFIVWVSKHSYSMKEIKEIIKKKDDLESNSDFLKLFSDTAKKQYKELRKSGNKFYNLNIVKEIFPEASICELEFSGTDERNERLLLMEFFERYVSESLMLLGDGGIGKTTMLFHILESYNNGSAKFPQVPLYVELNRCPSDVDSWCLDDKNSIFIEKYIASLLKGEKNIDKKDKLIKEIQHEFQKEPQNGEPRYLVLLDGLNEVASGNANGYSIRTILEKEIADDLLNYRNVRFIITSRSNSGQIKGIKKINISGVSESCIEKYLRAEEEKGTIGKGITDRVMKNKDLLNCLRIPLFLNMFGVVSGDTTITTRGEILRDFFQKKRSSLYLNKIEGEKINGFILDFVIPEIAWEMALNDSFAISFVKVQEIIEKIIMNKEESIALNKFSQKCFVLDEPPSYLCSLLQSMYNEDQRTKDILDIMVGSLAIIYVDDGEYKFKHHHFRDYFAALHIINEMKLGVHLFYELGEEGMYLDNIKKYRLHTNIIQFISESIGLHHSNPQYILEQGWKMREWDQNNEIVPKLLDVFRERFDDNIGWALWNIVLILNSSGMGLLGIDLSDLNLKNINFNGILCGIGVDLQKNAARFDNSLIDLNSFLPISHHEVVTDAMYSNNGQYILTVSDTRMILWNSTFDYINRRDIGKKIRQAIFSKDSNFIIYYTEDSQVIVWDLWKDEEYMVSSNYGEICDICTGDRSNSVYIAFKNGDIRKLHLQNRKLLGRILRVNEIIKQILFNKKYGQIIVRTENGDVLYGNDLHSHFMKLPFSNIKFMTQAQSGERFGIVTSEDYVRVGDLFDKELAEITCDCKNINRIQLSPDGEYLAIVEDGFTLQIYNIEPCQFKRPLQCDSEITSLSFSNDNKYVVTASGDCFVKIWEIKSNVGVCIRPLGDMADWIRNAYYSPDGNYIATSSIDSTGKVWDAKKKVMTNLLFGHEDRVTSISYDHTGKKVVTTSDDCSAKIWDVRTSGCLKSLKDNKNSVHNATFDKEDKRLVTVSWDKTGTIWELEMEEEKPKKLIGHQAPVHTVLFDASYKVLITASNDNSAIMWDAKTGKKKDLYVKHEDRLNSAAFSPDDKYIITSSFDKTAKIWKKDNGNFVKALEGHKDSVRSALFSPDGKYIVTVSRDTIGKLWDGHTFSWCKDLRGHTFFVRSAMFDKESQKVVTASYDGSIREWNLEGECTNIIYSIPGLFVCGCDFRNINARCVITSEQKEIFETHGAIVD